MKLKELEEMLTDGSYVDNTLRKLIDVALCAKKFCGECNGFKQQAYAALADALEDLERE